MHIRTFNIVGILIFLLLSSGICHGQVSQMVEGQLEVLNVSQVEAFIQNMDDDAKEILPWRNVRNSIGSIKTLSPGKLMDSILKSFMKEVLINSKLLGELIILAVLYGVLEHFSSAFEHEGTSNLAYMVCYLALMTIAIRSLTEGMRVGQEAIENMVLFMYSLMPLMLSLLVAVGGTMSAAVFTPITVALTNGIGALVKGVVFPLIFLSAILAIVSNISDKAQLSRLTGFMNQMSTLVMGLVFTIFTAVVGIYGLAAPVKDGIPFRIGKFLAGAFVPVVGNFLSEAVTVAAGGAMLIKSALGIVGTSVILVSCLFPAIKVLAVVFMYRLAAAIIQPIGSKRLVEALGTLGDSLTRVFAAMVIVAMMFFICIMVLVGVGSMIAATR